MRVGVEVGGTFTDLVAIEGGRVRIAKVPSTPARPDEGALAALTAAAIPLGEVDDLVHGSTVATNAILERKGAAVAFFVTRGFRDLLLLQRHNRRQIYDLFYQKPRPVVGRRDTFEVDERMAPGGQPIEPLEPQDAAAAVEAALAGGRYGSVAICLINAYANPAHERLLADLIRRRHPDLTVTYSHDVTREFREFERASTTTLSAYVQPVIDGYLRRFEQALAARGFAGRFSVMQSNGGRLPAAGMGRNAITSLFSGPAAGVMGAVRQATLAGFQDLITFDMGGTSTDVCLVKDGRPDLSTETEVDGLPIRTPVLDIVSVGAGGGSIAWMDDGGMLRVGPHSAGAEPGPACYGRGGEDPTVTDAHVIRGAVRPEAFLGGRMALLPDQAAAVYQSLADRLEVTPEAAADAAVRVADANIVRAIQLVSTERGRDPRGYVLVPFGGAGPLHACRVAEELGIRTVLVPPNAGVLSAFGLLAADFVTYETLTRRLPVDAAAPATVRQVFAEMAATARQTFAALGIRGEARFDRTLAMRYVGQAFEIQVPVDDAALAAAGPEVLLDRFDMAHSRVFEFAGGAGARAEIVSFRLGIAAAPDDVPTLAEGADVAQATASTPLYERGVWHRARLTTRGKVKRTGPVEGPALIEDETSTIYLPEGWGARVDARDNLVIEHREDRP